MIENYKILQRTGSAVDTGKFEITRKGTRKAVLVYRETYKTSVGEFSPEVWYEKMYNAIQIDEKVDLLDKIIEHCTKKCPWLRNEYQIKEYAMDCLASNAYKYWWDFQTS